VLWEKLLKVANKISVLYTALNIECLKTLLDLLHTVAIVCSSNGCQINVLSIVVVSEDNSNHIL
jgi:hypothetical protein